MATTDTRLRARSARLPGDELDDLRAKNLYRPLREMSAPQAVHTVVDGRPIISLSSNNYLGLTTHPHLRRGGRTRPSATSASARAPCARSPATRACSRSSSAGSPTSSTSRRC